MPEKLETPPDFHKRVRAARGYMGGVSQEELGEKLGMSLGYVKKIEKGDKGLKDIEAQGLVTLLSRVSGLSEDFFLARSLTSHDVPLSKLAERVQQLVLDEEARDLEVHRRLDEIAAAIPDSRSQGQPQQ